MKSLRRMSLFELLYFTVLVDFINVAKLHTNAEPEWNLFSQSNAELSAFHEYKMKFGELNEFIYL